MNLQQRTARFMVSIVLGVGLTLWVGGEVGCSDRTWYDEKDRPHVGSDVTNELLPILVFGFGATLIAAYLAAPKEWRGPTFCSRCERQL